MAEDRIYLHGIQLENNVNSFQKLKLTIITARLATLQSLIEQKNTDLDGVMEQINRLKATGDKLTGTMGTSKRKYVQLIGVYKQGLKIVQEMLRDALI